MIVVRIIFPFSLAAAQIAPLVAGAGCKAKPQAQAGPSSQPFGGVDVRTQVYSEEKPLHVQQSSVAVTQGPTPLVYLFDLPATVRVVDLTSGSAILPATEILGRTIVRVDDRNGVTIGQKNIIPGPLPEGHQYGIYSDPRTPNVLRRDVGPPGEVSPR